VPWTLPQRGALRGGGEHGLDARDVRLSRVCPLRGVWPLPYGVVPHVRDVLLPCDDALLLALTYISSNGCHQGNHVKSKTAIRLSHCIVTVR
jgi:hypothetical protein